MAKLDRLGWAAGIAITSYGARLGIRVSHPAALGRVVQHLPPRWKRAVSPAVEALYSLIIGAEGPDPRVRRYHLLYFGAGRLARTMVLDEVYDALETDLHFRVAIGARRFLFVHAGVVAWRGQAIVIPGRSGSGKTSLVAAFVRAGATYYSDEYAVLDSRGWIHPYARRLSPRGADGAHAARLSVQEMGGRAGTRALPVGLVLLSGFQAGVRWRARALSPAEGVLAMLEHTLLARDRPRQALGILQRLASGAVMLKGRRGEAGEFAPMILERLDAGRLPPAG